MVHEDSFEKENGWSRNVELLIEFCSIFCESEVFFMSSSIWYHTAGIVPVKTRCIYDLLGFRMVVMSSVCDQVFTSPLPNRSVPPATALHSSCERKQDSQADVSTAVTRKWNGMDKENGTRLHYRSNANNISRSRSRLA